MNFNIDKINVGDIYCSNKRGKMIVSPKDYKSRKLSSGLGIVISNNYGVVRIVSIAPNKMYNLMTSGCEYDLVGVAISKDDSMALRDKNGIGNCKYIRQNEYSKGFTWNTPKMMSKIFSSHKNEDDWYLPSYGELDYVRNAKEVILNTMSMIGYTEYPLYKLLTGKTCYLTSSTQADNKNMYSLDMLSGDSKKVSKLGKVTTVSMKMIKREIEEA